MMVAHAPPAHNAIPAAASAVLAHLTVHPLTQVAPSRLTASAPEMMSASPASAMETPANQCA